MRTRNLAFLVIAAFATCGGSANMRSGGAAAASDVASHLRVRNGFTVQTIASIAASRELASLPNGDLLVGTEGSDVYMVPNAEGDAATPRIFASIDDERAAGVAFSRTRSEIYIGSTHAVWAIPYHGERKASQVRRIANLRTGPVAPGTDGDVHSTTSVAYSGGLMYVAVGSSCNATMAGGSKPCTEVDPTRAAVSAMNPDGSNFVARAKRIRNAIALAVNPQTGSVWVGDAGQDRLPSGHPYEFLDDLTAHRGVADYGWPQCEENHHAYWPNHDCSSAVEPLVELPAYSTIIGAAFYPLHQSGTYAFPAPYRGGLFAATHGSWHRDGSGCNLDPPRVVFVGMNGDRPTQRVDWNDPTKQWIDFLTGFQTGCSSRIGRPTGVAIGPQGTLFVADDDAGAIYRVRPVR